MLSKNGYFIPRELFTRDVMEDLTATPEIDTKFTTQYKSFPIYIETLNGYYIPKSYGITKFGYPQKIHTNYKGKEWNKDITFNGELYEYQKDIAQNLLDTCLKHYGAILQLDTGLGKTVIALNIISKLKGKTIIVVNKVSLLEQWKESIQAFLPHCKISTIQGRLNTLQEQQVRESDITITMIQSLSRIHYDKSLFTDIKTSIIDEIHNTGSEMFSKIFFKICSKYSIGLSATPKRIDNCEKVFKYHIGNIIETNKKERKGKELVVKKIKLKSDDYIEVKSINRYTREEFLQYSSMITGLINMKKRNELIVKIIKDVIQNDKGVDEKRKILVLSDRRAHLEILSKMLKRDNVEFSHGLFLGAMKKEELDNSRKCSVILATYQAFGEGVSEKDLNTLILTTPKKFNKDNDSGKLEQIVGRIFRKPHLELEPIIIDIQDDFSIFSNHSRLRNEFYRLHFKKCSFQTEEKTL